MSEEYKFDNVVICNLRKEQDMEDIAQEFANYYTEFEVVENWTKEATIELFKYFYNHNKDLFFVAYYNDKPVGVIMAVLKPWWNGLRLVDTELFVCKEYRKKGIAKKLFKKLFEYAIEKYNVTEFEAQTYEDENGFPFIWYKRLGAKTLDKWKIITIDIKDMINKL